MHTVRIAESSERVHVGLPEESVVQGRFVSYAELAKILIQRNGRTSISIYATKLSSRDWVYTCNTLRDLEIDELRVVFSPSTTWKSSDQSDDHKVMVGLFIEKIKSIKRISIPNDYFRFKSFQQALKKKSMIESARLNVCSKDSPVGLDALSHVKEFNLVMFSFRTEELDLGSWLEELTALKSVQSLCFTFLARTAHFLSRKQADALAYCVSTFNYLETLQCNVPLVLANREDWHCIQRSLHLHSTLKEFSLCVRILNDKTISQSAQEYMEVLAMYNSVVSAEKSAPAVLDILKDWWLEITE